MTKSTEVGLRGDLQKINRNKKIGAKLRPPYPREFGKPFVVIMPCSTLTTRYFRDLFQDIQVIVPRRRIQFRKLVDGVEVPSGRCSFDCLYFCCRIGLPRDVVFLT